MKSPSFVLIVALMVLSFHVAAWTDGVAWAQPGSCVGDCNQDQQVTVDELVTGIDIALDMLPVERCAALDRGGDDSVTVDELTAAVDSALAGCGSHGNRAPRASALSFSADTATPYVEKQLIGSDPDGDTIAYELVADETGPGYAFAGQPGARPVLHGGVGRYLERRR